MMVQVTFFNRNQKKNWKHATLLIWINVEGLQGGGKEENRGRKTGKKRHPGSRCNAFLNGFWARWWQTESEISSMIGNAQHTTCSALCNRDLPIVSVWQECYGDIFGSHTHTQTHTHMQESLYKLEVVPYQQTVSYEDQMVPSSLDVYLIFTDVACFIGDRGRPIIDAWVTQQGKHKIEIEPFRKKFNCICWEFLIIILKSDVGHIYADENVWTSAQNLQEDAESLLAIWRVDRNIEWKSQSATISIGSDTNDKSFFICIYFAFSHTCSTQVYPFLSLVWGYRAREGEKSSFFFVASKIE